LHVLAAQALISHLDAGAVHLLLLGLAFKLDIIFVRLFNWASSQFFLVNSEQVKSKGLGFLLGHFWRIDTLNLQSQLNRVGDLLERFVCQHPFFLDAVRRRSLRQWESSWLFECCHFLRAEYLTALELFSDCFNFSCFWTLFCKFDSLVPRSHFKFQLFLHRTGVSYWVCFRWHTLGRLQRAIKIDISLSRPQILVPAIY
jgi:hypothetical protein